MATQEDFEAFDEYYVESKQRVDQRIDEIISGREDMAKKRKILAHATAGGKRIRPVLTMLVADRYEAPYDTALDHAAIVELIHNASLVADDLQDGDIERRGMPTTWKILDKIPFGRTGRKVTTGLTIMTENGLVALAMEIADDPDVVSAMGHGLRHLVDGFFAEGQNVTWGVLGGGYDKYIEVNRMKTGGLFGMAAWMPATYTDATEDEVMAARKYGEEAGVLYQIADDYVDDDLPSFIKDPFEEMEKWYDSTVDHISEMPDIDNDHLMRAAPAWMVYKMAEQEGEEFDVDFIPDELWEGE